MPANPQDAPARPALPGGIDHVLAQMPQIVWVTDANGLHTFYNAQWYEFTGLSETDSLGFGFTNALHPDDRVRTVEAWRRAWQELVPYEIEYRFRRHDGAYRWFVGRANPVRDEHGRVNAWVGTCTDIDDAKRAATASRFLAHAGSVLASSLDYETTLVSVAQLVVPELADWCAVDIVEDDGQTRQLAVAHKDPDKVRWARELARRYPPDPNAPTGVPQVLRSGRPEWVPNIPWEMLEAAAQDEEHLEIIRQIGFSSYMIVPMVARGRTVGAITFIAAESGRSYDKTDLHVAEDVAARAALAVDNARLYRLAQNEIAERRRTEDALRASEARLRRMFESNIIGVIYWSIDGRVLNANGAFLDMLGLDEAELDAGHVNWRALTPPEFHEADARVIEDLLRRGVSAPFEKAFTRRDGASVPVLIGAAMLEDRSDQGVAFVLDLTDRKRAEAAVRALAADLERRVEERTRELRDSEAALIRVNADLRRSNEELEQFAYVASHDLQEPLRMVSSYTQLLARRYRGQLGDDADEFIAFAVDGVTRMQQLINDLLAYSRIGTRGRDPSPASLEEPLEAAVLNLQASIDETGAVITHDPLPSVVADHAQVTLIFQNLIGNALKFHGEREPHVHVSAERDGKMWRVAVRDEGIGIDEQYADRIFVIFQRLHGKQDYPGNGIGLAVCKKIVERHGGRIWFKSTPGRGTTFYFTLPAAQERSS